MTIINVEEELSFKGNLVRVFISYNSANKILAGEIKNELDKYGLITFLAHEDIQPSAIWINEIIRNLKQCDVFLPLLTDSFHDSEWTDQESGYAFALDKLIIPLKIHDIPYGFINQFQALKLRIGGEDIGDVLPKDLIEDVRAIVTTILQY